MRTRIPISVLLVLIAYRPPAHATTLVRLSLEQLTQASTEIVRGRVINQESRWNGDHTQIVTLTTLAVEDRMKGRAPATVVIEQIGGTVGDIRIRVAGTALFTQQESYMLFLEPSTGSSRYLLVGMAQGCYRIFHDRVTHEERVSLPLNRLLLGSEKEVKTSGGLLPLKEFRKDLSAAMEAPVVIPRGTGIPVAIQAVESRGVGRLRVLGQTTAEIFPSLNVVVPAGSPVEGDAERAAGKWRIHWTELAIRGQRVAISAISEEPADATLRGRTLVINVR